MSYFRKASVRPRALSGVSTMFPVHWKPRVPFGAMGSLGDDTSGAATITSPTLTVTAPPETLQWQANVLSQLQAGVATLQKAELQKWLQIAATLSIPVAGAIWKMIFKRGAASIGTGI
jgi:hypothetical protein